MPSSISASFASPVPFAASLTRLVRRCKAMSIVPVLTPVSSAACRKPPRASVVTPILSAVFASVSMFAIDILVRAAAAAVPAVANANPILAALAAKRPADAVTDLKAAAVLSVAVIGRLYLGAAIVLYPKICLPFLEF